MPSSAVTASIMRVTVAAASLETTRCPALASTGVSLPSASTVALTTVGSHIVPALAIAPTARTICIAVTEMPWPNEIVA